MSLRLSTSLLLLAMASNLPAQTSSGYYRFEEGAPNGFAQGAMSVVDSSCNGAHGTPSSGPVYRSDVPQSSIPLTGQGNLLSLELSRNGGWVQVDQEFAFHSSGDATLEFWLKFDPHAHQSVLWTRTDNSDRNRFNFFVNSNGTFGFDYRSPSGMLHKLIGAAGSGIAIAPRTWTHLAIVRSGDVYSIYRDGILADSAVDNAPALPSSGGWRISGRSGYFFGGHVDEVRITDRALSPAEFLSSSSAPILEVPNLAGGTTAQVSVRNLLPGHLARIGYSTTGCGPTPTVYGDVDLSPPFRLSPPLTASATGVASWSARVPAHAAGMTVWVQAVNATTGELTSGVSRDVL